MSNDQELVHWALKFSLKNNFKNLEVIRKTCGNEYPIDPHFYQGLYRRGQESLPYVQYSCMSVSYSLTYKTYIQNL